MAMGFRSILPLICLPLRLSQKMVPVSASWYFSHNHKSRKVVPGRCFSIKVSGEKNTINEEEVQKFQQQAKDWWDSETSFSVLAAMNRLRVPFIRDGILSTHSPSLHLEKNAKPLKGFTILDVGCGGGLLSEPLARLGANVTGLDPGLENIKAAESHMALDSEIRNHLEYECGTVEDLCKGNRKYNAVVCSEVIEHVDNVDLFVKCCIDLVEDNGSVFFTTINRTAFSYVAAILLAEYALGVIPRGTHDWKKFITPHDLKRTLLAYGCRTLLEHGMLYNPVRKSWFWSQYDGVSYALHAVKENVTLSA